MIDYLIGSIVKFELNFEKALENKCESQYDDDKCQVKHWCVWDEAIDPL